MDTRDRYEMEWISLARATTYGCAGCTLHNSLNLSGTDIFMTRISQQMAVELRRDGFSSFAQRSPVGLGKWLGARRLQCPREGRA